MTHSIDPNNQHLTKIKIHNQHNIYYCIYFIYIFYAICNNTTMYLKCKQAHNKQLKRLEALSFVAFTEPNLF